MPAPGQGLSRGAVATTVVGVFLVCIQLGDPGRHFAWCSGRRDRCDQKFDSPPYTVATRAGSRSRQLDRTLYVPIGRLRGGVEAWCSFARTLPRNSSVALFLGDPNPPDERAFKACLDKYNVPLLTTWYSGEPKESWAEFLDFDRQDWFKNDRLPAAQYLGKISPDHEGTGGILLAYRYLLQKKVREIGPHKFDRLVLTRSDFLYMCPQELPLPNDRIYIVHGEAYGGVTDRHTVFPWGMADVGLNVTSWLAHATDVELTRQCPKGWGRLLWRCRHLWLNGQWATRKYYNLEQLLAYYFETMGLPVQFMPRVQFLVRRDSAKDSSTWSQGENLDAALNNRRILVKYPEEYAEALQTCGVSNCAAPQATCFDDTSAAAKNK